MDDSDDLILERLSLVKVGICECAGDVPHVLQDGNILTVVAKYFRGAEVLLQPSSAAEETIGFFDKSFQTVMKCDV